MIVWHPRFFLFNIFCCFVKFTDKFFVSCDKKKVKAGGMRIVQHKTPNTERPAKDPVEVIGLSNPPPTVQTDAGTIFLLIFLQNF